MPHAARGGYNARVRKIVEAQSGGITLRADLDFELGRWSLVAEPLPQEGDFPFITEVDGKRYELYSDETFDEVEC